MSILDLFGAGPIATLAGKVLDMFPNAEQRAEAENKLQDFALAIANNQATTNTAEATTGSFFLAGWRPFIAWNCGVLFCLNLWLPVFGFHPAFDAATANNTVYLLLGLGTWRTADKLGGVATAAIKKIFK